MCRINSQRIDPINALNPLIICLIKSRCSWVGPVRQPPGPLPIGHEYEDDAQDFLTAQRLSLKDRAQAATYEYRASATRLFFPTPSS